MPPLYTAEQQRIYAEVWSAIDRTLSPAQREQYARKPGEGQSSLWDEDKHPRASDGKWTEDDAADAPKPVEGQHVEGHDEAKKAGARRSKNAIVFDKPIVGPSGAGLSAYDWKYMLVEEPDAKGDDIVTRRVSDWEQAELNEHTGRDVVHQFSVALPGGKHTTVSLETAIELMGLTEPGAAHKVHSLADATIKLAQLRQQLERDEKTDPSPAKDTGASYARERLKAQVDSMSARVGFLSEEARRIAAGESPIKSYRAAATKLHALNELFKVVPRNGRMDYYGSERLQELTKLLDVTPAEREKIYVSGKEILRALWRAGRRNMIGEAMPNAPWGEDTPNHHRPSLTTPKSSDQKIRNWYQEHGEDAEKAIVDADAWLRQYHPGYAEWIKSHAALQPPSSSEQYARKPSHGQRDLFDGANPDIRYGKAFDESQVVRDELGEFAKKPASKTMEFIHKEVADELASGWAGLGDRTGRAGEAKRPKSMRRRGSLLRRIRALEKRLDDRPVQQQTRDEERAQREEDERQEAAEKAARLEAKKPQIFATDGWHDDKNRPWIKHLASGGKSLATIEELNSEVHPGMYTLRIRHPGKAGKVREEYVDGPSIEEAQANAAKIVNEIHGRFAQRKKHARSGLVERFSRAFAERGLG